MIFNRISLLAGICAVIISCAPSVSIITDSRNGLQWLPAADRDTSWYEARDYVSGLNVGGYTDWRLPSKSDLQALYHSGIDPKTLNVSGRWAWTSELEEPSYAWIVSFYDGLSLTYSRKDSYQNSVLPVRLPNNKR